MGINDFFENRLGVKRRNKVWSWGASNPDTQQIFLCVWEDDIQTSDGLERIMVLGTDWIGTSHGFKERKQHLEELRKGAEGYGVLCTAVDIHTSEARSIKKFDRETLLKFGKIIDEDNHVFVRIVDRIPIENLYSPIVP